MKIIQATTPFNPPQDTAINRNRFSESRTAGTMPVYQPPVKAASFSSNPIETSEIKTDTSGFSFKDVLDVINPLQHLPIIGTVYREVSGDKISSTARVIGGALFGGPIGGGLAFADSIVESKTGSTVGEKLFKLVSKNTEKESPPEFWQPQEAKPSYRYKEDTRTAGTMPIWHGPTSPETLLAATGINHDPDNTHIS